MVYKKLRASHVSLLVSLYWTVGDESSRSCIKPRVVVLKALSERLYSHLEDQINGWALIMVANDENHVNIPSTFLI